MQGVGTCRDIAEADRVLRTRSGLAVRGSRRSSRRANVGIKTKIGRPGEQCSPGSIFNKLLLSYTYRMNTREGIRAPVNRKEILRAKVEQAFSHRFNEKDCENNPFSKAEVEADLAFVAEQEAKHKSRETPQSIELKGIADSFEALVLWNGEMAGWFGKTAQTVKTSKFDDYKNGVDMIVSFPEGRSVQYLGLATDVTFSSDPKVMRDKFSGLRSQIRNGTLATVKYFHHGKYHEQLRKLPEVIIGVSIKMVRELEDLWVADKNTSLANHRVGVLLLKQIEAQLIAFGKYAQSMNQTEAAQIYGDRLEIIRGILAEKAELVAKVEETEETDLVHLEIMKSAQNWSRY